MVAQMPVVLLPRVHVVNYPNMIARITLLVIGTREVIRATISMKRPVMITAVMDALHRIQTCHHTMETKHDVLKMEGAMIRKTIFVIDLLNIAQDMSLIIFVMEGIIITEIVMVVFSGIVSEILLAEILQHKRLAMLRLVACGRTLSMYFCQTLRLFGKEIKQSECDEIIVYFCDELVRSIYEHKGTTNITITQQQKLLQSIRRIHLNFIEYMMIVIDLMSHNVAHILDVLQTTNMMRTQWNIHL